MMLSGRIPGAPARKATPVERAREALAALTPDERRALIGDPKAMRRDPTDRRRAVQPKLSAREATARWCAAEGWPVESIYSRRRNADMRDARTALIHYLRGIGYTVDVIAALLGRSKSAIDYLAARKLETVRA